MINASNEAKQLVLDQLATGRLDRHNLPSIVGAAIGLSVLAAITLLTGSVRAQIPELSDADWMTYNRNLQGDRYSPLKEIATANIQDPKPTANFDNRDSGPV